ncbi:MAG TPA: hypothetical protein VF121_03630 [Thermoanaerobaculia bacterium]|nr:hypothetical protein [Thermoanaerobaculia bacterium]
MAAPALRAVLVGASNVSLSLGTWVAKLRGAAGGPVEVLAACGNGRSYGAWSRFLFVRTLPGIVRCGLWDELARRPPMPTVALVADVGNDILYEHPVERIAGWVDTCLARLAEQGARTLLATASLPVIAGVGPLRYLALRSLIYPGRSLPFAPARERAVALDAALRAAAAARGVPVVVPEPLWYGRDPIHVRRSSRGPFCDAALTAWDLPCAAPAPPGRVVRRRGFPGLPFAHERLCGVELRTPQPARAFADGTNVSFF